MKIKSITRVLALILVLATLFTTAVGAASIGTDYPGGYVNVMIRQSEINNYLNITYSGYSPVALSGRTWSYITADGKLTGAAYCIDHGGYYPSGYITVSTKPYTASPALCGAVACGFPQTTLAAFTAAHSDTAGMTESEFSYATQLAVWAALNQIGVAGTAFTSGLGMVEEPTDAAQLRVFRAVQGILSDAQSYWFAIYRLFRNIVLAAVNSEDVIHIICPRVRQMIHIHPVAVYAVDTHILRDEQGAKAVFPQKQFFLEYPHLGEALQLAHRA